MERNLRRLKKLHFDLITENILPILPAKSLVRFTWACKTWYCLIKSPQFIATHLNVNRQGTKGHQILILGEDLCYVLENQTVLQEMKLDFCIDYLGYGRTLLGSCNGLIFLPIRYSRDREYVLWNPSINKLKKLESKVHSRSYEKCDPIKFNHEIFGLGIYESYHIVVRIRYVIDDKISGIGHVPTQVDVYSLCTESWHEVDSYPIGLIGYSGGVFVNGVIHWLATTRFTMVTSNPEDDRNDHFESILLFDSGDESLKEMALPKYLHYTVKRTMDFNAFNGSLAAIIYDITPICNMFALWVMTDYGDIDSWNKKFTIIGTEACMERWPLGLLRCGKFVYSEKKYKKFSIVFFDVYSGEAQKVEWLMDTVKVMDYMNSLVLFQN